MKFESFKDHILSSLVVGTRHIHVISERQLLRALGEKRQGYGFGIQITPIYLIVLEVGQNYAFSLETGDRVEFNQILLKIPSLKNEIISEEKIKVPGDGSSGEQIIFKPDDFESLF